ncbi:MAG: LysM peptidoglycan-binding domain-containing protein [Planctomycetota bacterium]
MRRILPLLLAALLCAIPLACSSLQYRVNEDGVLERVDPEDARQRFQRALSEEIQAELGPAWAVATVIEPPPYYELDEKGTGDYWQWDRAAIAVRVVGDGSQPAGQVDRGELAQTVRRALRSRVHGQVEVQSTVILADPETVASLRATVAGAEAPIDDTADGLRAGPAGSRPTQADPSRQAASERGEAVRYVIQEGDTLAIISTVFYGDASHWRRIVQANPSLDPDRPLPVGTAISIP